MRNNNNNKKSEYPCICFKKWICKLFPQREFQDQMVPSVNSIKYLIPWNLLKNTEEKWLLINSFYKIRITIIQKPDKGITKKKDYKTISFMNTNPKILNKETNQIQQHITYKVLSQECKVDLIFKNVLIYFFLLLSLW